MKVLCDNTSWVNLVSVVDKSLSQYGDHYLSNIWEIKIKEDLFPILVVH